MKNLHEKLWDDFLDDIVYKININENNLTDTIRNTIKDSVSNKASEIISKKYSNLIEKEIEKIFLDKDRKEDFIEKVIEISKYKISEYILQSDKAISLVSSSVRNAVIDGVKNAINKSIDEAKNGKRKPTGVIKELLEIINPYN